jgi:lipoprotein-anchoring transpeptidase ErfK/SrfK
MRRSAIAALSFIAAFAVSAPAFAYDVDPLTGQRVAPIEDGRAKASPITRTEVDYNSAQKAGTIIIDTAERRLYLILAEGRALRYGVGVGRPGFEWSGTKTITRKSEWPDWRPPAEMRKRRPDLPDFMPGGPQNPLGARAMYLGSTLYRIHGSNEPETIGQAVSSGCIRMMNEDVIDLYSRVTVGTKVIVKAS